MTQRYPSTTSNNQYVINRPETRTRTHFTVNILIMVKSEMRKTFFIQPFQQCLCFLRVCFVFMFFLCEKNLLYPSVPTVDELLLAHTAVPGDVENHKEVADLLGVHPGYRLGLILETAAEFSFLCSISLFHIQHFAFSLSQSDKVTAGVSLQLRASPTWIELMHLPKTSSLLQILHWNLLVWFPLVVSEECLANCRELIDVDRIVPENKAIKSLIWR